MKITLRKALNLKNKLVGEINELGSIIVSHNRYETGRNSLSEKIDVKLKLSEYIKKKNDLTALKIAIVNANANSDGSNSIYGTLMKIEETKSLISFLKGIQTDTTCREQTDYRTNTTTITEVKVQVSYEEIQGLIKKAEKQIEEFLDAVEEFNGTTRIEVNI